MPSYDLQFVSRADVAMLTALTYDTVLNIDQEYCLIWKTPWSAVKVLYLCVRYSTFVDTILAVHIRTQLNVDPAMCHLATSFIQVFAVIGTLIAELILTVRTYALYEQSAALLVFLSGMWLSIAGVTIWALIKWTGSSTAVAISPADSCTLDILSNPGVVIACSSFLIGETVVFLLTVWKGVRTFSLSRSVYRHSELVTTFYRDGILFYLAMFVILILDLTLAAQASERPKLIADSARAEAKLEKIEFWI
ncbi:hypothetical protein B0H16DRAFT_1879850 [Mycena metata]|uniref:DUF6533 domain-containing protein n=1 Tax=Mycena metata TaxID=1033252 RepID=A0AAD7K4B0_9AGAR|nr:hypothetical protein B0H16DRAFT_1879850 [Mycena metata]